MCSQASRSRHVLNILLLLFIKRSKGITNKKHNHWRWLPELFRSACKFHCDTSTSHFTSCMDANWSRKFKQKDQPKLSTFIHHFFSDIKDSSDLGRPASQTSLLGMIRPLPLSRFFIYTQKLHTYLWNITPVAFL